MLGCSAWLAAVAAAAALAWMLAEVCWLRDASREPPLFGGVVAVVAAVSMCCCVELIHRARMGSRKVGGRRDTEGRSSRAERKSDLLIMRGLAVGFDCLLSAGLRSFTGKLSKIF